MLIENSAHCDLNINVTGISFFNNSFTISTRLYTTINQINKFIYFNETTKSYENTPEMKAPSR